MKLFKIVSLCLIVFALQNISYGQDLIKNAQSGLNSEVLKSSAQAFDLFEIDNTKSKHDFSATLSHNVSLNLNKSIYKKFRQNKAAQIQLDIPVDAKHSFSISLAETTVHSNKYLMNKQQSNTKNLSSVIGKFYHGNVVGDKNSKVAVSVFEDYIRMLIIDKNGTYILAKLKGSEEYIIYNDKDILVANPFKCGSGELNEMHNHAKENKLKEKIDKEFKSVGECVDIYVEADYKTYQDHGNSVTNVENFISALINEVKLLYEYDGEIIHLNLDSSYVHTSPDPYVGITGAFAILSAFGGNVQNSHNANLAHFISTRPIYTSIAWQDVLCASYTSCCQCPNNYCYSPCSQAPCSNPTTLSSGPYAVSLALATNIVPFPTYSWAVNVFAHEMGHNFGSPHTQDCVWGNGNQKLDNCYGGSCSTVSPAYGGTVMSYCHVTSTGTDFNLGFGQEPWDLIYGKYASKTCTSACPSTQCSITNLQVTSGPSCNGSNVNITIQFSVSNGSGSYQVELWGGVVSSFSGTTNGTVNKTITVSVAPGTTSLKVKESGNNNCSDNVSVTIPNCSPCSITNLQVTSGPTCSGNNVNFTVQASVSNGSGNYNVTLAGVNIGSISGLSNGIISKNFLLSTTAGNKSLVISDATNGSCSIGQTMNIPDCACNISNLQFTNGPSCNGTDIDFSILFNVANGTGTYDVEIDGSSIGQATGTGNGNVIESFTLETSPGTHTVSVIESSDPTCNDNISTTFPDCSGCNISNLIVTSGPDCNGTNNSFILYFDVNNGSGVYKMKLWNSVVATISAGTSGTIGPVSINTNIAEGITSLEIVDNIDSGCSDAIPFTVKKCDGGCPSNSAINNETLTGMNYEIVSGQISSLNTTINSGANVVFDAGSSIEVTSGFEVKAGAVLHLIAGDGCN